ncbi:MAG: arsenite methyltransferase [Halobacteriota archaeon]
MSEGADPEALEQRTVVRERYAELATGSTADGCCDDDGCRSTGVTDLGYEAGDVAEAEAAAKMSLGCGNPTAIASLEPGDTVVDLGSGGGFDCFLAAREVGETGRVIGVDMTPEMVERARATAARQEASNVEFRLGEIEHLPVADASVDVVISNCVVNLSPDKPQVFREAHRALRPGGRLSIADVVRTAPLPGDVEADPDFVAGCVAGAASISELESMLSEAGFVDASIEPKEDSDSFIREWDPEMDHSAYLVSARIEATKPHT